MPKFHIPDLRVISVRTPSDFLCLKPSSWGAQEPFAQPTLLRGSLTSRAPGNTGLQEFGQLWGSAEHLSNPSCAPTPSGKASISANPSRVLPFFPSPWLLDPGTAPNPTPIPLLQMHVPPVLTSGLPVAPPLHLSSQSLAAPSSMDLQLQFFLSPPLPQSFPSHLRSPCSHSPISSQVPLYICCFF